jgi:hypothetical protein
VTIKTSFLMMSLVLVSAVWGRDEYTRRFDQKTSIPSGRRILIENKFGDVVVHGAPGHEVAVHADIRVSGADAGQAKEYADKVEIRIEPNSDFSIRTRYPDSERSVLGFRNSNISYSVRYDIAVPETSPISIRNAFGAVLVTGAKASSDIVNSHGDLTFRDGRGAQRLENSFASVQVNSNVGDVTIENSNGSVGVADVTGALTVRDRFARLTVARISKAVTLVNTNGEIEVTGCGGPADIRNSFGRVAVHTVRGDVNVNNNNGAIELANVEGSAVLRTTFSAVKCSDVRRDLRIESGNGSVVASKVGGVAAIKTSFGMVQASDVAGPLTVQNANGSVTATNTKGAQINTSFGAVTLNGIAGPIQIENQNGAVDASSNLRGACQPVTIRTSFAPLRIHLEPDASYRVSARTSFGKIKSDFPLNVSGSISNDDFNGTLGSGKCEMRLTNNNGSIEIVKVGP